MAATTLILFLASIAACAASKNSTLVYAENYKSMSLPDALLSNTVKILQYDTDGNKSYVVRVVEDHHGNQGIEYLNILTIQNNYMETNNGFEDDDDDLCYNPNDSTQELDTHFNVTRERRGLRSKCSKFSDLACFITNPDGKIFFKISYKYYSCGDMFANRIKFRFRARLPGTYIIRISAVRGSYVVVIRTYKKFQAVVFQWPRESAHLGQSFKAFLMVHPHSKTSLFDGSFSWSWINLRHILKGCMSSADDDFNLIFRQKNVALLEQMSRFDNSHYVKIASCTFNVDEAEGGVPQ